MKKLIFTLLMICLGVSAIVAQTPKRIAFLTDPTNKADFGTVPAWQVGLDSALIRAGYTVDVSYTPFDTVALAGYDLIIASRNVSSSDFSPNGTWNRITKPILILSIMVVRDSRMRLLNGQAVIPADSSLINPNLITYAVPLANVAGDSVFNNVVKSGAQFPFFKGMFCYLDYYLSDFNLDVNKGKPMVLINDTATDGAGSLLMVRWEPGVEAYPGTGILAGKRSFINIGTDDNTPADHYNLDNYTPQSLTLFNNEVKYLLGLPIPKWSTTNVKQFSALSTFKVYPTPATDGIFTIQINDAHARNASVQIYSLTGQQVYSMNYNISGNINVQSGLKQGMYLLVVNIDGNKTSQKIIFN
jgi:hypothetical protein